VACDITADYLKKLHQGHGVNIIENSTLVSINGEDGKATGATFGDGQTIAADVILVAIGALVNDELAQSCALNCDNGIVVDAQCRTSDPDIFAIGDCTNFVRDGQKIRLESVQNAADQGDVVAQIINDEHVEYNALPWFWSDQYDCKLQIAGLSQGYSDTVLRPGNKAGSQSVWYYAGHKLIAVEAMNDTAAYVFGRKMLESNRHPSKASIAESATSLKAMLQ
jgi:3-phenylpropionate/trans-cinnamate dioxygenase ferredoxin reductase subunit